tara:strand:- start:142 stop:330 length:189 start_codon:yes stop_codon:yes gene_type:complete
MPQNDNNTPDPNVEVKFFGNEVAFTIGDRPIKVWELIVGILVLSIIAPIFYRRGGNGSRGRK